ncbi:chemotaxis protein CheD [Fonticella tunisiensis]|uniref:Probable chemoreceptor glutamine deamidase CheD n=1 Tax=Fonticella tunisiensis TaxID=1096341 RepID=A0A4R7K9C8_9CLOT|nr:chemotaxis protein CheD [Fonticella tunisiensis]TDT50634.1 chemotaxis protein CheD [Fonticella tunisiensis]
MDEKDIKVGIGDLNVALPPYRLITLGLGSCVGIALYDSISKVAGLAHIMLPDSSCFKNQKNPMKFADAAIPILIDKMLEKGASRVRLRAKIAGGASMFSFTDKNSILDIGSRNVKSVMSVLSKNNISLIAEDTGGNFGRTMIVEAETGKVYIRTAGKGIKEL